MAIIDTIKKGVIALLSAQIILVSQMSVAAQAEVITTEAAIAKYSAQVDRAQLLGELQKQEIRDQIIELGIDPAEAEARLAALSDDEIRMMLTEFENDPAGADTGIIGALLTVFIILLITDLLCFTNIFPFARCIR